MLILLWGLMFQIKSNNKSDIQDIVSSIDRTNKSCQRVDLGGLRCIKYLITK